MAIEYRICKPDELSAALTPIWHYFGRAANEEDAEKLGKVLPTERVHVAVENGKIVGGAGAYLFDTTVPGGARVPTAGVMAVGVLPTHRRRGILSVEHRRGKRERERANRKGQGATHSNSSLIGH